jgi:hypothetical protein
LVTEDDDVIAGIADRRSDPDRTESGRGISLEKSIRQDMARTAREEDPVG